MNEPKLSSVVNWIAIIFGLLLILDGLNGLIGWWFGPFHLHFNLPLSYRRLGEHIDLFSEIVQQLNRIIDLVLLLFGSVFLYLGIKGQLEKSDI